MSEEPLLSVTNLEKHYPITEGLLRRQTGTVRAVDGVSFDVTRGEAVGLVGESGCGKSTTALSVLRLEDPTDGDVRFDGEDVLSYDDEELRRFRRRAQLVLQDPDSAFNPRQTVGEAIEEPLRIHGLPDPERRRHVVEDTIEHVGLPADAADGYPHEFSGGERQRLALARALVLNPDLLIADEPVSALDGRTKSGVLELLARVQSRFDVAIVLISHDVDLVRRFCDRVAVMYLGRVVERGAVEDVLTNPAHPYTQSLVEAVPSLDPTAEASSPALRTDELPDATDLPNGCRFHPRCPAVIQPEGIDLPREEWLGVTALRFRLANEWDDETDSRELLQNGAALSRETTDPSFDTALRNAFDLPEKLSDPTAESALETAIDALESGSLEAGRRQLADGFASPCEEISPAELQLAADDESATDATTRLVACHHYDDDVSSSGNAAPATRFAE